LWWLLFGGTHVIGSMTACRTFLIRRLGMRGFKAVYTLVALATFIPLCATFFANKHAGGFIRSPAVSRHVTETLMLLAFVILGQALAAQSPLSSVADLTGRYPGHARGILRVTRHPQNLAFAIFGFAHCLANPLAGDWIFFGGFVVYALVSAVHQDRRTLASGRPEIRAFHAETSLLPLAAILAGRQRLVMREWSPLALIGALAAWAVVRLLHPYIFGGFMA